MLHHTSHVMSSVMSLQLVNVISDVIPDDVVSLCFSITKESNGVLKSWLYFVVISPVVHYVGRVVRM